MDEREASGSSGELEREAPPFSGEFEWEAPGFSDDFEWEAPGFSEFKWEAPGQHVSVSKVRIWRAEILTSKTDFFRFRKPSDCFDWSHSAIHKAAGLAVHSCSTGLPGIIAGSLESANSSILAARRQFKEVVGKKIRILC